MIEFGQLTYNLVVLANLSGLRDLEIIGATYQKSVKSPASAREDLGYKSYFYST